MMAQDLGIISCFEAMVQLHQHLSQGCCGLIGELWEFDFQEGGGRVFGTPFGEGEYSFCHDFSWGG